MSAMMGGEQIINDFRTPSGTEYALALRLSGKFKTAFPDGKPKTDAKTPNKPDDKAEKLRRREPQGVCAEHDRHSRRR